MKNVSFDVVICGAGIAGVACAYHLAVKCGVRRILLVDERDPLTLTSDKGTQGYRNWWPGPDDTMLRFVSRSIDIMEDIARESGNAMRMNRRGYLFATADEGELERLRGTALRAEAHGMGTLREHGSAKDYIPSRAEGFEGTPDGADLLEGAAALLHFPFLNGRTRGALHVRRAGWLSAVALGSWSLTRAVAAGVELVRDRVAAVRQTGGRVQAVTLASGGEVACGRVVLAAGPKLLDAARMLGLELPVTHELHAKLTMRDTHRAVPRDAPFVIWTDALQLDWSSSEREALASSGSGTRLLGEMPGGVHLRPHDGTHGDELFLIWTYHTEQAPPVWPPRYDEHYAEALLRGAKEGIPSMAQYAGSARQGLVDGGYYSKAPDNRPLIGPLEVEGAFVCAALSGFGLMAAHGAGELLAAHVTRGALPGYSRRFLPVRFENPVYLEEVRSWGALSGQL